MFLTTLLAWIAARTRARRDMRSLAALSDEGLRDIGLTRSMVEDAPRRPWGL